jgi:hypothetical protein
MGCSISLQDFKQDEDGDVDFVGTLTDDAADLGFECDPGFWSEILPGIS